MGRGRVLIALTSAVSLVVASACGQQPAEIPRGPASIAGRVTAVQRSGERIGSIRVESQPGDSAGSPKAVVRVGQRTGVTGPPGAVAADFNALRVGQWVRVWFTGPVRESYPVQADAQHVAIDSTAAP